MLVKGVSFTQYLRLFFDVISSRQPKMMHKPSDEQWLWFDSFQRIKLCYWKGKMNRIKELKIQKLIVAMNNLRGDRI